MDSDWQRIDGPTLHEALARKANLRVCFDGAKRGTGSASGGIAVFAYYLGGRRELVYRAGVLFGELKSAFLAECLALEWCLNRFEILVKKMSLQSLSSGK